MRTSLYASLAALLVMGAPAQLWAQSDIDPVLAEGMELVEKDRRGAIYADPGVDWSGYDKIMLDDATVAFRKNWQRDQHRDNRAARVSTSDMEKIKAGLAELFDEVFVEELSVNGHYEMVDQADENVLRITPHIVDLDVYAPQTTFSGGRNKSYVDSAGKMTLKLEIYDSQTGDLMAVASDHRESPRRGYAQWATAVSNRADARRMLQKWAIGLRTRLDEATASDTTD